MELHSLCPVADYAASRPHIFRSPTAFRWFVRQNKAELVQCGALALILGAWFIDPEKADAVLTTVGQRKAAERVQEAAQ